MSAPPISSTPLPTPDLSTSSPLPVARHWSANPLPAPQEIFPVGRLVLPAWPSEAKVSRIPPSRFSTESLKPLPAPASPPPSVYGQTTAAPHVLRPVPAPAYTIVHEPEPAQPVVNFPAPVPAAAMPSPASIQPEEFTDEDLRQALAPIFQQVIEHSRASSSDAQLEPMLRATIRRALAEYSPGSRPFQAPGTIDRFIWRLQALFSSRTYEDILFDKTHRFQIDEVYLLDASSLALVSYASSNPARHSSPRRIENTVHKLAYQLRDEAGKVKPSFKLADDRNVISHEGEFITLLAIVRGRPNDMALSDLAFSLDRIEERFRERFQIKGSPLLQALQPFLEDCLLIQAPASAA